MINNSENPSPIGFEEIEHTADWAYRVLGESLEDLFVKAAEGLYHLAGARLSSVERTITEINLKGVDKESLLVAWLNELLYLHDSENVGGDRVEFMQLNDNNLSVKIAVAPICEWVKDIKAVTYHNLEIIARENHFEVTIVLDV